jgi:metallophosphoesterase superfamily enzyme
MHPRFPPPPRSRALPSAPLLAQDHRISDRYHRNSCNKPYGFLSHGPAVHAKQNLAQTMSLLILHLSDLHIKDEKDDILNKSTHIAQSAFSGLRQASVCLIIVTGDLAYSGAVEQFTLAASFLNKIRETLKAEGCHLVDILVVPGNHDCALTSAESVRSILIDRVVEMPATAEDLEVVAHGAKCVSTRQLQHEYGKSVPP